nr:restriction endonuclease subunit S [Bacteroidales bacterium]
NRKGDEGIKYVTNKSFVDTDNENFDSNDKSDKDNEVVEAINSIKFIDTTLYNPNNNNDNSKFAYAIRKHIYEQCRKFSFGVNNKTLTEEFNGEMGELLSYANLSDMIDFRSTKFDKSIKLTVDKKIEIVSKFDLVKLETIANINYGTRITKKEAIGEKYPVYGGGGETFRYNDYNREDCYIISRFGMSPECVRFVAGKFFLNDSGLTVVSKSNSLSNAFLNIFLFCFQANIYALGRGSAQKNLDMDSFKSLHIPIPPLTIQHQIVSECEKVDEEYNTNKKIIDDSYTLINNLVTNINNDTNKIKNLCDINQHTIDPTKTPDKEFIYIDIDSVQNGEGYFKTDKIILGKNAPSRARRYAKDNSILISTVRPNLKGFAFINKEIKNAVYSTGFAIIKSRNQDIIKDKMIYYLFMYSENLTEQMIAAMPKGQYPSINKEDIENFQIPVPPLAEQQRIVSQIEQYEAQIAAAKAVMFSCAERKKKILEKYLN